MSQENKGRGSNQSQQGQNAPGRGPQQGGQSGPSSQGRTHQGQSSSSLSREEAARKGVEEVSQDREHMAEISKKGSEVRADQAGRNGQDNTTSR